MIERAVKLQKKLTTFFNQMEKEKIQTYRASALEEIKKMIGKLKETLDYCNANADMRNKSLYSLRELSKKIAAAININTIRDLIEEAEIKYDSYMEELE
jgi:hypothetical protein